jgi:NAD(P)-dependent dehydrogenase (short-subunit alcohol dehydrogenase family)
MNPASGALLPVDGRVVMISGANRGMGLETARRLHDDGYRLSLGARNPDALAEAVAPFADDRVLQCRYDAIDADAAERWVAETTGRFGQLDALVNNAGILRMHGFEDYDEARLDELLEVNLKGPYRLTVAALPYLRQCGVGRIVNINSRSGLIYRPGSADYNISKHANMALTHGPRYEFWEDGVRSTAICPGPTDTDMAGEDQGRDETLTHPGTIAAIVSLVLTLPNAASVPIVPVCCDLNAM